MSRTEDFPVFVGDISFIAVVYEAQGENGREGNGITFTISITSLVYFRWRYQQIEFEF